MGPAFQNWRKGRGFLLFFQSEIDDSLPRDRKSKSRQAAQKGGDCDEYLTAGNNARWHDDTRIRTYILEGSQSETSNWRNYKYKSSTNNHSEQIVS